MEAIQQRMGQRVTLRQSVRRTAAVGAWVWLVVATGCVGINTLVNPSTTPPAGHVCQIVTTWNREVVFPPDTTHNGAPTPTLTGRLYLFGPEIGVPLVGDGNVTVDLFDDRAKASGGDSVLLEEWRIDPGTLKQLLKKDIIGWGYTLILPWATYKPEITQVHLMVRYEPPNGVSLFAPSSPLTLENPSSEIHSTCKVTSSQQVVKPSNPPGKSVGPQEGVSK